MKLGILGAGMIVHDFLSFAPDLEGVEIKAINATPRSVDKLKDLCEKYNIPAWYTDIDECINDPQVDTVYVALPNHLHYDAVKKSLEAGKNVICEKPFTANYAQAEELAALAREKNLFLLEAVSTRYLPNVLEMKKQLPQLGKLKIVNMNYSQYSSRYDAFKAGNTLPAFDPNCAGGALMDLNIYNINLAVMLFGEPKRVEYLANIERGIDTSGVLIMDYDTFKCVCVAAKDCKAPILSCIQGDEGCMLVQSPANVVVSFIVEPNKNTKDRQGSITAKPQDYNEGKHRMVPAFVAFEKIIREGDHKTADEMLDMSLVTMKIQNEARKSAGVVFPGD